MKNYVYKIQWLIKGKTDAKKLVTILGARSFTKILVRDINLNILENYNGFLQFPYGLAEVETKKWIEKQSKKPETWYFEFFRR